jgi:hypothetical protein
MRHGDDAVQIISAILLDYIACHPDAADSNEGIRRWWLPGDIAACTANVEAALERLVQLGELARQRLPDGGVLYKRRRN